MDATLARNPSVPTPDVAVYLDPPTHHLIQDRLLDRESNPYAGDDILAPYVAVRNRLASGGVPCHTADRLPDRPDGRRNIVISFGARDRLVPHTVRRYAVLARRSDVVLSAFFAMECPVVEPTMFTALPAFARQFRRVMSWSDSEALRPFTGQAVRVEHFCWPQSFDHVHPELWERRDRKFLMMMNANKLPRLRDKELYTARLAAVEFFHRYGDIDLYGRNWDRMPTRVGKVRTPAVLRKLVACGWPLKQQLWP
ncbi:MAG: hypothetical protein ACRELE_00315, partial [Gemmatimonadales bacterium]